MKRNMMVVLATTVGLLSIAVVGAGDSGSRTRRQAPRMIVDPGDAGQAAPASSVWIGVRLTPVPEAVRAHISRDGLMISNIVSGSPADDAGLKRYDVITSFNGTSVTRMEELTAAIAEAGENKASIIGVLRGGNQLELSITPASRPTDAAAMKYKHEDAPGPDASPEAQYFGHRFQRDATGNWVLEPLGRLPGLPDDVKNSLNDLSNPAWQQWHDMFKGLTTDPLRFRVQPDNDDPDRFLFFYPESGDENANVEIRISASENGETITIQRGPDGTMTVERVDANGKRSETTYATQDELRNGDAEAYRTFRRYSGYRSRPMITLPPDMKNLQPMQQDFQEKIQKALERAREQTERALQGAGRTRDLVREQNRMRTQTNVSDGTTSESISLTIDDGRIRLSISKDGDTKSYEFENADDFKNAEPDLYKKYEALLRGAGASRGALWNAALACLT